ncbi:MAG TPA: VWA domain-containing protein [Acidobacteriota bacterium]|jgi:VWFA-related protein|nr:VWA domain-containing protein [Acidobacteriota bacterium]
MVCARLCLLFFLLSVYLHADAQRRYSIRVQADYVRVPLTILDPSGHPLTDIRAEDLKVFENGKPRPIVNFVQDQGPVYVALAIDSSGSVQEELGELKHSAQQFARQFSDRDRICVATFSSDVELLQDWTHNKRKVRHSIDSVSKGFRTALYDALYALAEEQLKNVEGKRAIILLTDGLDNDSRLSLEDARRALLKDSIALYVVSKTRILELEVQKSQRVQFLQRVLKDLTGKSDDVVQKIVQKKERQMTELADATGGRIFFPDQPSEYHNIYEQVARELKQQYLLTYPPLSPERNLREFKKIEIDLPAKAATLIYRKGYY